jgi:hypothetical protein
MTQNDDQAATPPWDAARVNLTSKELAPGVFAVLPDDVSVAPTRVEAIVDQSPKC